MRIDVKLDCLSEISIEEFRQLSSELEILSGMEIPHNNGEGVIENNTVKERTIRVVPHNNHPFSYRVSDYAHDKEENLFLLGHAVYGSKDLNKGS